MLFDSRDAIEYKKAWEWYNNIVQKSFTLFGKSGIIEKYNPEQPRDPETGQWLDADGGGSGTGRSATLSGAEYADKIINAYFDNPKTLGDTTPKEKYDDFKAHGVDTNPLKRGTHEGKSFEDGGGFKINLKNDGKIFSYHPAEGSRHGDGEYYKLSSGKTGIKRYDMEGNIITDEKD